MGTDLLLPSTPVPTAPSLSHSVQMGKIMTRASKYSIGVLLKVCTLIICFKRQTIGTDTSNTIVPGPCYYYYYYYLLSLLGLVLLLSLLLLGLLLSLSLLNVLLLLILFYSSFIIKVEEYCVKHTCIVP